MIEPREFILAETLEYVHMPNHLAGMVEGRSRFARAGLSVHQTAPFINPGWKGKITLEILNNGPFQIKMTPEEVLPCQLILIKLETPLREGEGYGSKKGDKYQDQDSPTP